MATARRNLASVKAAPERGAAAASAVAVTRHRMRAVWDQVLDMLTGKAPRKDSKGRDMWQVWADAVLENPPVEFERALRMFPNPEQKQGDNSVVNNIGALYLQAIQSANRSPEARIVELEPVGATRVHGDVSDW